MDKTTIGSGLISLLFGVFFLVERNSFARDYARWQRRLWSRWERWLGINLGGHLGREETQKRYIVATGMLSVALGIIVIVVGIVP